MPEIEDIDWEAAASAPVAARDTSYGEFQTVFGGLDTVNIGGFQPFRQADSAYGGNIPQRNEPYPLHGVPGIPVPEPMRSPDWNSPPARRFNLEATTNWGEMPLGNIENFGMGWTFDNSYQQLDQAYGLQSFQLSPNQGF